MDVFGLVQLAADGKKSFGVGSAANLTDGIGVGRLHADFKLEQSLPHGGKKVDHLLVNQMGGQLKVEVGDPVVVLGKIAPDCHCVLFGAVEGAVHKFDLLYSGIQKALEALEGQFQRKIAHPAGNRGQAVAATEGTAANRLEVEDAPAKLVDVGIGKGQLRHVHQLGGRIALDRSVFIPPAQRVYLLDGQLSIEKAQVFQKGGFPLSAQYAVQGRLLLQKLCAVVADLGTTG